MVDRVTAAVLPASSVRRSCWRGRCSEESTSAGAPRVAASIAAIASTAIAPLTAAARTDGGGALDFVICASTCTKVQNVAQMHADEFPGWISRNLCGGQAVAIVGDFVCIISGGVLMLIDLAICATTAGERELELGATLSLDASDSTRDGWAAERRRHHSWGSRAKRGHADGTLWALGACRGLTVVCVGCGSLVH